MSNSSRIKIQGNTINGLQSNGDKGAGLHFVDTSNVRVVGADGTTTAGMTFYAENLAATTVRVNNITQYSTQSIVISKADGVKSYYGTADPSNEIAVRGELLAEVSRATSAELSLTNNLSGEVSRATSAELSLSTGFSTNLSSEVSRATSAELSLTNSLSGEVSRALSAELSLSTSISTNLKDGIDAERSRAISAELSLTNNLSGEVSRATSAELSLTNNLSGEVSRATSAELSLSTGFSTNLSAEVSRATSAELSLSTGFSTNLSAEVSRATSAELSLSTGFSTNLSGEVSRATSAELSLSTGFSTNLSAEVSRAMLAEFSLDNRLDRAFSGEAGFIKALSVDSDVSANAFLTTSDIRLKKDIAEVSNALELVNNLHPVLYNWIDERPTINPGHKELGFLAQEVEAVMPNVVRTVGAADGLEDKKIVAYDRLVALLVGAVKELKAEVDALKH